MSNASLQYTVLKRLVDGLFAIAIKRKRLGDFAAAAQQQTVTFVVRANI